MANNKQKNKETGDLGETIASNFLKRKGLGIIERNYWRKWGEIDIIARGSTGKVHFIEVKTVTAQSCKLFVSYETKSLHDWAVTHETWRPEEQVHSFKKHQISKAINSWLAEHNYEGDFQVDVVAIRVVPREKYATVKYIENILLSE